MTLARYATAWLVGIALAAWLEPPARRLVLGILGCAATLLALQWYRPQSEWGAVRRPQLLLLLAIALCVLLGALREVAAEPRIDARHIASWNDREEVTFRGMISAEPDVRDTRTFYRVAVDGVRDGSEWSRVRGAVLVQTAKYPPRSYGDTVQVTASVVTPPLFDGFDYRAWLAGKGIHSIARRPRVDTIASGGGNPVRRGLISIKSRVRRSIAASIPEPEASLATGILLGDDNGIPEDVYEAFRVTNTSHVIAISGSNVALLVALLSASFGRLFGRREAVPLILVALCLYTALVGADAAVVRAAVMGGITVFGVWLGRPSEALTALFAAAWAMTLYRPAYIDDLGFQLSFAATIGLIAFSARWTEWAEQALARRLGDRRARSATGFLGEAVVVTLAAQATTWPVIAHQTGEVSLVGLAANFLIVPAQPAVMILGGLAAFGGTVWGPAGTALGSVAWLPLAYTVRVVEIVSRAPMALVVWSMPIGSVVMYYGVLWSVARPEGREFARRVSSLLRNPRPLVRAQPVVRLVDRIPTDRARSWSAVLALAGACALVWSGVATQPDGLLHMHTLDVGQGDAHLIVTPNGRRMLVDGGPGPSATLDGLGRHMAPWDRRLDVVVLTHADSDHVGGLAAVLDRYRVSTIVTPGVGGGGPDARAWEEAVDREGAQVVRATQGLRLVLDEPADVEAMVIWPDGDASAATLGEGENNKSVVLRLRHGNVSMLLTGDIEESVEARLVGSEQRLGADVLKVSHHGSETSTTDRFLRTVSPQLAVISVGLDNDFGHPSPAVLERLAHITVRRTDLDGTIDVISDGREVWVR